jgi:hypothetical protein
MAAWYRTFDPLLPPGEAEEMVRLCERFGAYRTYAEEPTFTGIGEGLPARYDAVRNFLRAGGARLDSANPAEPLQRLGARTNYFRETYAYGDDVRLPGVEPFFRSEAFIEAARRLHGRPVVEPAIVYANLLLPGQELAVHTDVPEFRGVNRKQHPQWLIVAMHHSGLFADWRMPIATAVAWFHGCRGGEFVFYPDGPTAPPVALPVRHDTAILLDTDSVFHGVARLAETAEPVDRVRPGMQLRFAGSEWWELVDGEERIARYRWADLRFSVSWKAYCFADEPERRAWREHSDDLSVERVVDRLLAELRRRGRLDGAAPDGHALVDLIVDEYIRFPAAQP